MQIYLDYSATTPPRLEVIDRMQTVLTQHWGNPSSLHAWGQRSALVLEQAREQVAALIHATPESIAFTSGGTESNNLALLGVTRRYAHPQHVIISRVEHSAIEEPARRLEAQGWQVTRLPVDSTGRVNPLDLQQAIRPDTVLVSVIYGQSEVGTLQPIQELSQITRTAGILFHTDAVQVAGRLPLNVQTLAIDLLSLSSHKLYGPQGAGALYIRPGVALNPVQIGGGQESNLRSGTQALATLAGFGLAAERAGVEMLEETARLRALRDRLFDQLATIPELIPTGNRHQRLPHHLSFCINHLGKKPLTGKTLVRQMNLAGIGISSGSACNSGKLLPSRVLVAMGHSEATALSAIRLTLGKYTTEADINWTAMVLKQILTRLLSQPLAVTHDLLQVAS